MSNGGKDTPENRMDGSGENRILLERLVQQNEVIIGLLRGIRQNTAALTQPSEKEKRYQYRERPVKAATEDTRSSSAEKKPGVAQKRSAEEVPKGRRKKTQALGKKRSLAMKKKNKGAPFADTPDSGATTAVKKTPKPKKEAPLPPEFIEENSTGEEDPFAHLAENSGGRQ
ncbi:MAG: hypothetical protein ACQEQV_08265 [Fibrobacterota bacterium]